MASGCNYCEVERLQLLGGTIFPVRQLPYPICALCPNAPDWLPVTSYPVNTISVHIPGDNDLNSSRSSSNNEVETPHDDGQEDEKDSARNSTSDEVESPSISAPSRPELTFGIENILYGSSTRAHSQRKPPRPRPVFSPAQRQYLEKFFHRKKYLQKNERTKIASLLSLSEKQVKIWFQNRRVKRKQEMHQHISESVAPASAHGYLCQQCFPH